MLFGNLLRKKEILSEQDQQCGQITVSIYALLKYASGRIDTSNPINEREAIRESYTFSKTVFAQAHLQYTNSKISLVQYKQIIFEEVERGIISKLWPNNDYRYQTAIEHTRPSPVMVTRQPSTTSLLNTIQQGLKSLQAKKRLLAISALSLLALHMGSNQLKQSPVEQLANTKPIVALYNHPTKATLTQVPKSNSTNLLAPTIPLTIQTPIKNSQRLLIDRSVANDIAPVAIVPTQLKTWEQMTFDSTGLRLEHTTHNLKVFLTTQLAQEIASKTKQPVQVAITYKKQSIITTTVLQLRSGEVDISKNSALYKELQSNSQVLIEIQNTDQRKKIFSSAFVTL